MFYLCTTSKGTPDPAVERHRRQVMPESFPAALSLFVPAAGPGRRPRWRRPGPAPPRPRAAVAPPRAGKQASKQASKQAREQERAGRKGRKQEGKEQEYIKKERGPCVSVWMDGRKCNWRAQAPFLLERTNAMLHKLVGPQIVQFIQSQGGHRLID